MCVMEKETTPSFGRTILSGHQDAAIISNGLRAVHGGEESRADGDFRRRERVCLICRKRETRKEKSNDRLTRLYLLSTDSRREQGNVATQRARTIPLITQTPRTVDQGFTGIIRRLQPLLCLFAMRAHRCYVSL